MTDRTMDELRARLGEAKTETFTALMTELDGLSGKLGAAAREALPDVLQRRLADVAIGWLDAGVAVAESSGATALRYFRESPLLLGLLDADARPAVLSIVLELAETQPNLALDFLRSAPELLAVVPANQLPRWAAIGAELASIDYVLGIEFLKQAPAVARVLPVASVRDWVGLGVKLVTQNSLGKTDYVGTLEFFRTSPLLLGELQSPGARHAAVQFASVLADRRPEPAIAFVADAPGLLQGATEDWALRLLRYGVLLGERDAEAALAYIRRCGDVLALVGSHPEGPARFEAWYRGGMEILEYSAEGARAYFALETRKALASIDEAMSAVPLRSVARTLKLFAEGLCGHDLTIRSAPAGGDRTPARAAVSPDGRTLTLPEMVNHHASRELNMRHYLMMTAHEAGHLEFGTYALSSAAIADLAVDVATRYGRPEDAVHSLADLFALYPQPALIRDLWTVLEDARVEQCLRQAYPGLRADLAARAHEAIQTRSLRHGFTARELVVDSLLLLTAAEPGTYCIPDAVADVVARIWECCRAATSADAGARDTVLAADRAYVLLDSLLGRPNPEEHPTAPPETEQSAGPRATETSEGEYRPVTNLAYRGEMRPEQVATRQDGADAPAGESGPTGAAVGGTRRGDTLGEMPVGSPRPVGRVEEWTTAPDAPGAAGRATEPAFVYDEWDGAIGDYRTGWCRVTERPAPVDAGGFVDAILTRHGPAIALLRRYFESLRPTGLWRLHGQTDGDALDFDAVMRWAADRRASADDSDRLYMRREKREREVAVAFLVDLSGSTSRQLADGRPVIDVEKEGLVLLCQALDAIGDQYAVYGYSGQGRAHVEFTVLKAFDEPLARTIDRIGAMAPRAQNRDGAAIRHATRKLRERDAQVRLLVLLSDGKPLDDGYTDEYALEDTKAALREARAAGVHPFCITVDRDADDYLRRMYGDVQYLVIDQADTLPQRLPRIYRRLTA